MADNEDSDNVETTPANDVVVTKYKMAGDMVNGKYYFIIYSAFVVAIVLNSLNLMKGFMSRLSFSFALLWLSSSLVTKVALNHLLSLWLVTVVELLDITNLGLDS
ncbi:hypothetical protein ElyMa_003289300 [Elysia marginata]|uniref:Uncharacterized protein n=1 Tax=Elysia marginata TaxID=1093978 RepID=A0AAV4JAV5_9GAST|nr:hypothetical protein ElyMa_003289300 [Elysia marginata]